MKNKLGLYYYKMMDIERKLVNLTLNLLDETFTFNCNLFSLEYLINLNKFLFEDIYEFQDSAVSKNEIEVDYLKQLLKDLECAVKEENINKILGLIEEIWYRQFFVVGNTRTMVAYLKVIKESFLLDIPLNVNADIESNPKIFRPESVLTKKG